jgi:hypothetical protein
MTEDRLGPPGTGKRSPRELGGIDDVDIDVEDDRTVGEAVGADVLDRAPLDAGGGEVRDLRRVQVPGIDQDHALLRYWGDAQGTGEFLMVSAERHPQRHPAEIAGCRCRKGVYVTVSVKPHDRGVQAGSLGTRQRAEQRETVASQHRRHA